MSLSVTIYVPSGIVMAADSRVSGTLTREETRPEDGRTVRTEQRLVFSDSADKVFLLEGAQVGVSTFDTAIIEKHPVESHVRRFEEVEQPRADAPIEEIARKLVSYFRGRFPNTGVGFHIAGFRREGSQHVPYVYSCHNLAEPTPTRRNANESGQVVYGITRSGETVITNRLIDPHYTPVFDAMPLQDAIDYAIFLIRTTVEALRFEPRFPSVGGPIDVLVITPREMRFVQHKSLHGESASP